MECFLVSIASRIARASGKLLGCVLVSTIMYLMFFWETEVAKYIYLLIAALWTINSALKDFKKGDSFILYDDRIEVLKSVNKIYAFSEFGLVPVEQKQIYSVLVFRNKEIKVTPLHDPDFIIDTIDCNTLSHKKFSALSWKIRDLLHHDPLA